jgi:hypothetical protein
MDPLNVRDFALFVSTGCSENAVTADGAHNEVKVKLLTENFNQ